MLIGFGGIGASMRRRRKVTVTQIAKSYQIYHEDGPVRNGRAFLISAFLNNARMRCASSPLCQLAGAHLRYRPLTSPLCGQLYSLSQRHEPSLPLRRSPRIACLDHEGQERRLGGPLSRLRRSSGANR